MNRATYQYNKSFNSEIGGTLANLEISYTTYGKMNTEKDNVIWVCHALTANSDVSEWWPGLFGEGELFDPAKHFIICANNLGSPYGSSSPLSNNPASGKKYGIAFPKTTLRDSAKANILLAEHLGIQGIHLLIGGSCGGNIALEMAYLLELEVEHLVLMCSAAQESPFNIGVHEGQRMAIEADSSFGTESEKAGQLGLKAARGMALNFYRTFDSINTAQKEEDIQVVDDFKASSYIRYQGEKLVQRFDPTCYYKLLKTLDTHNIGRGRGSVKKALSKIVSNTLCLGIDTDILIPIEEQKFLADYIPKGYFVEIKSAFGHDGFLLEYGQITSAVKAFLK